MVFPFWGLIPESLEEPDQHRFEELAKIGSNFLELSDHPSKADVILLPFEYVFDQYQQIYNAIQHISLQYNKPSLIFFNNDSDREIIFENAFVFRTSYSSKSKRNRVYALPAWSDDFVSKGNIIVRRKSNIPTVGYCGYVDFCSTRELIKSKGWKKSLRFLIFKISPFAEGEKIRGLAVRILNKAKNIKSHFIIRKGFWAYEIPDKKMARDEYVQNIINSDYVLSTRGGGNFSYRFYEVLSCGRIPLFINTDSALPYEEFIDWRNEIVWVEEKQIRKVASILKSFHHNLTAEGFIAKQHSIRRIYDEWISPVGFHRNLYRIVLNNQNTH